MCLLMSKQQGEPLGFAGVNSIGLRRRGFDDKTVKDIEDIYRILYVQNNNVSKGIDAVKELLPSSVFKDEILQFVADADKGIIKGLI